VRPTLAKKIGLLLLLPFIGSLAGTLIFAAHLQRSRAFDHVVNVAGRQRMLAAELRDWAHMVSLGQEGDRAGLRPRVAEFEQALVALQQGGRVLDDVVDAAPPELRPELAAVASLWNALRPDLLTVAEAPRGEARFVAAYQRVDHGLPQLRDLANRFVIAFVARRQRQQDEVFWALGFIAVATFAVFQAGLVVTRRYIVRPIAGLETVAKRMQAGDFSFRLDASARDELGTLAGTFNQMSEQVQQLLSALHLRRRHAETIIASVPSWLFVLREDLTVLRTNRSFQEAFGLDESVVAGEHLTDLLPAHGLREAAFEVLSSGKPKRGLLFEMPWKGGKRSLRVAIAGIRLEDEGEEERVLVAVEDLNEEEQLAALARASERRFQEVVENATDGIVLMGEDGLISCFNRAAERMFGWRREEVLGEPVILLMPESYRAAHERGVGRYLVTQKSTLLGSLRQLEGLRKDGTTIPIECTMSAYQSDGDVVFTGVLRDVTERNRAEAALRRSEADLRGLIDRAVFGIFRSAPDGRLLMVNRALVEMLGYDSPEELLSMESAILYQHPEERSRLPELYAARDYFKGVEVSWKRKDGTPVTVRLSGKPVHDAGGKVVTFEVFVEDVTERIVLEQQLRQSQKMESVGRIAGGIAHDFNNLISIVRIYVTFLEGIEELPERARRDLREVARAAERASELTEQLLAFGRRKRLNSGPIDLASILRRHAGLLDRLMGEDVTVHLAINHEPALIVAEEAQIERVLINLAGNARDAMPSGGTLTVTLDVLEPKVEERQRNSLLTPGVHVRLAIRDSGIGMGEQTLAHLFEPFFTTKPAGQGTGLGLASVHGVVTQSGGCVEVKSAPGAGTTFSLWFPAASAGVAVVLPVTTLRPGGVTNRAPAGTTVLLVEDEPALRKALVQVLRDDGLTVLVASDAMSALRVVERHDGPLHVVITDVMLPGMSGQQLVARIAAKKPGVRALFVSGYSGEAVAKHGRLEPGSVFLSKPFTPAEFLGSLDRLLHG
jgi:hypothetical protein